MEGGGGGERKGLRLMNTYGVTEACVYQTAYVSGAADGGEGAGDAGGAVTPGAHLNVVGQALDGVILEVEGDKGRRGGVVGEVLIGGRQVARGYLGHDALSAEKFFVAEDGVRWFRSGDNGQWVGGGGAGGCDRCLEILGRRDLQVKLRGFRIEVEEIEAVLLCSGLVRAAAVTVAGSPARLVAWLHLDVSGRGEGKSCGGEGEGGGGEGEGGGGGGELREEGARVLEDGGECALRLLCMRRMPLHQVCQVRPGSPRERALDNGPKGPV